METFYLLPKCNINKFSLKNMTRDTMQYIATVQKK